MAILPVFIEEENGIKRSSDIYSRLLEERTIIVEGEINIPMANAIVAQLLLLETVDPDADITMYINSPGGEISAGLAIADTMEFITCDVATVGMGMQASMGSFLLASGEPGKRFALKRSSIMIHRLSGGQQGDYHSMESNWEHTKRLHEQLLEDYARLSGGKTTKEQFEELMRYDNWLTLEEGIKYGIIDKVIATRSDLEGELHRHDNDE